MAIQQVSSMLVEVIALPERRVIVVSPRAKSIYLTFFTFTTVRRNFFCWKHLPQQHVFSLVVHCIAQP